MVSVCASFPCAAWECRGRRASVVFDCFRSCQCAADCWRKSALRGVTKNLPTAGLFVIVAADCVTLNVRRIAGETVKVL
jgi:hypothetical protein